MMLNYGNNSSNGSRYFLSAYYVQGILCYLSHLIITNKALTYPFCQWNSKELNILPNSHNKEVIVLVVFKLSFISL